jgi:hypothetical protein
MKIYLGAYQAGDFFRYPTSKDVKTALAMCEQLIKCPNIIHRSNDICFVSEPPYHYYANWEGQIKDPEDPHFRLDLQGKPVNFDVGKVQWKEKKEEEVHPDAKAKHWAEWQLQFGSQKAERLTSKHGKSTGYRDKHKGALAGVMLAQCRWVPLDAFQQAMLESFKLISTGQNIFGVLTSDEVYAPPKKKLDPNTLPKALFFCEEDKCAGYKLESFMVTAVFANILVKNRYVKSTAYSLFGGKGQYSSTTYSGSLKCPKCGKALHLMDDLLITEIISTKAVLFVED